MNTNVGQLGDRTITLFTYDEAQNLNSSDCILYNLVGSIEVKGVSFENNAMKLHVSNVAAAGSSSNAAGAAIDLASNMVLTVNKLANDSSFTASSQTRGKQLRTIRRLMRENPKDQFDAIALGLAETDPFVKFKGDYKIWMMPYLTTLRNSGNGAPQDGSNEKYYGVLIGGSHFVKDWNTNLIFTLGFGLSKTNLNQSSLSGASGKNILLGISAIKKIWEDLELTSSLYSVLDFKKQTRYAAPDLYQRYLAESRYKTKTVSSINELGYVFKLNQGWSLKPNIGLQLGLSHRSRFKETNIPETFSQRFKIAVDRSGELYSGLGVRKKWITGDYETKLTLSYQIGQKSGNNTQTNNIYFGGLGTPLRNRAKKPGRTTHYINFYGSVYNNADKWKIIPSFSSTLQKRQTAMNYSLKFEYRF
jgi:hypothetical protein